SSGEGWGLSTFQSLTGSTSLLDSYPCSIAWEATLCKHFREAPRACECWQERKVREKSRGKGNQKGGREREKKRLVSGKKDREDQEKSKVSNLWVRWVQMVAC